MNQSRFWTTHDIANVTGLSPQAINSRISNGRFIEPVSTGARGVRMFDPVAVVKFFSDEATEEMIGFLDVIINSSTVAAADHTNAVQVKAGLIDGSVSILDVVKDLNV